MQSLPGLKIVIFAHLSLYTLVKSLWSFLAQTGGGVNVPAHLEFFCFVLQSPAGEESELWHSV